MALVQIKAGGTLDTNKAFILQIYTTNGHLLLLAGSKEECRLMTRLLSKESTIYKIKMISPSGKEEYLFI